MGLTTRSHKYGRLSNCLCHSRDILENTSTLYLGWCSWHTQNKLQYHTSGDVHIDLYGRHQCLTSAVSCCPTGATPRYCNYGHYDRLSVAFPRWQGQHDHKAAEWNRAPEFMIGSLSMVMIHPMVILIQVPATLPLVVDGKESLDMVREQTLRLVS